MIDYCIFVVLNFLTNNYYIMKKILYTTLLTGLIILSGCSKQSNSPTPTAAPSGGGGNTTAISTSDFQGLWYKTYRPYKGAGLNTEIYTGANCKVDLTSNPIQNLPGYYEMLGNLTDCSYPNLSGTGYSYNATSNSLNGYYVETLTTTDLQLSYSGGSTNYLGADYFYTNTAPTYGATENINWQVNLATPYPTNGELEIKIQKSWDVGNNIFIPITTGQLSYSGTIVANTAPNNYLLLQIRNISNTNNANTINCSSTMTIGNITSVHDTDLYCINVLSCSAGLQLSYADHALWFK